MFRSIFTILLVLMATFSHAESVTIGDFSITMDTAQGGEGTSNVIKVFLLLTILSIAPSLLIVMTSFTRIILVLSMLRHALGMQQTPPNNVLLSLALFLTIFTMSPVLQEANDKALKPLSQNKIGLEEAIDKGLKPFKVFMLKHTREQDLSLMFELSHSQIPKKMEEVSLITLVPAFMISELFTAFKIGFIIFLPFLLVDIVVSSLLMSMGMLMVPPMMMSLPIKIMLFVLVDGWNLIIRSLMNTF